MPDTLFLYSPSLFDHIELAIHQLNTISDHTDHRARLQHLATAPCNPMLNVSQALQPRDHDLWRDLELGELF